MIALAGCATAPAPRGTPERFALDVSQCADEIAVLPRHALVAQDDGSARIDGAFADFAQCIMLDEAPVPAALFALADLPPPLQLRVQLIGRSTGTLAASLALLDAEFRLVREHGFREFARRGLDRTLTTFVNPQDGDVRYLLVRPDPEHVGTHDRVVSGQRWATVWVTPAVMGSYADGVERVEDVPLTDAGALLIELAPYTTASTTEPSRRAAR